jgi:aminoglycoside phosphotransferase family enzyme
MGFGLVCRHSRAINELGLDASQPAMQVLGWSGTMVVTPKKARADHVVADQSEIAAFLSTPATHGAGIHGVERIDTHGAMVFLAGQRAYKLKRAVRFPYMDFSTLALRRAACEREVELNRRTAPDLYLGVVPVKRAADGRLSLGGAGKAVDWLVLMRRFDQDGLFDRLAQAGRLTPALLWRLADEIANFHRAAEPLTGAAGAGGGAVGVSAVIEENIDELAERPDVFDPEELGAFAKSSRAELARVQALLDRRLDAGFVRRCHGDLHLRNICAINGRPTIFDAIEFNDTIACIDVLYDLAFLLMDLDHRNLRPQANLVFNRYLEHRNDLAGLKALPLFLSMRAVVRAKVSVSLAEGKAAPKEAQNLLDEARAYLLSARAYLTPCPPRLVALGGLSGSGKTYLARRLAPGFGASPGALHLRSDLLRKARFGVDELTQLPAGAYSPEESRQVYAELAFRAQAGLLAEQSVIADAVYAKPEDRAAIEAVARELGLPFTGLWLEAPEDVLYSRVTARKDDASDATPEVVRQQLDADYGPLSWHRLDTTGAGDTVTAAAEHILSSAV